MSARYEKCVLAVKQRLSKGCLEKKKWYTKGCVNPWAVCHRDVVREVYIKKSTKPEKKFMVRVGNKTIHFGAKGMSDYTIHKDKERMYRYVKRHRGMNENWKKSGIATAGFWSKHLLWNKPSMNDSIKSTEKKFGIKIKKWRD